MIDYCFEGLVLGFFVFGFFLGCERGGYMGCGDGGSVVRLLGCVFVGLGKGVWCLREA